MMIREMFLIASFFLAISYMVFLDFKSVFGPNIETVKFEVLTAIMEEQYGEKIVNFVVGESLTFTRTKLSEDTGSFSFQLGDSGLCLSSFSLVPWKPYFDSKTVHVIEIRVGDFSQVRDDPLDIVGFENACNADYPGGKIPVEVVYKIHDTSSECDRNTERASSPS